MDASDEDFPKLYLESLSEKELKAYFIAKSQLGTSFQLEKSVGYIKWKEVRGKGTHD